MRLYVCWGTFSLPGGHPCRTAHEALKRAGYEPEVVRSYGSAMLPDLVNQTPGRRDAKQLTGSKMVPVLVTDGGDVISDSKNIVTWAEEHPAG